MERTSSIYNDQTAVEGIKENSRDKYIKAWISFKLFSDMDAGDFEMRMPSEEEFLAYFRHLRNDRKLASTTMWTTYSMINSVVKGKYGDHLQKFPRLTTLLKSFDTDIKKKAAVFENGDLDSFVTSSDLSTPYWLVRKVKKYSKNRSLT